MATGGGKSTSDEIVNFKCTPCAEFNKVREAVKYCVECKGYCCQSCVDMHQAFPALKGHHLKDKSTSKSTVLTSGLPVVPTDTCDIHEIKILDMYCGNHDVVGCTSCMALEHRNCTDVQVVPDVIDTLFEETAIKEINQKLLEMKTEIDEIKTSKEKCLEELEHSRKKSVNVIKEFRKELEDILRAFEEESINEVDKCFNQLKLSLENEMEEVEKESKSMKQIALHLMKSEANRAQQFVSVKVSQKKIAKTNESILALQKGSDDRISFAPDSNIKNYLQRLKSLGSVTHESTAALREKASVYVINSARELKIEPHGDSYACRIYGSCITDDSELLLTDMKNKNLKRVDIEKMSVVDQCSLPCSPYFVCQTQKKEAVATLKNNSIQFISLDGQLNTSRQITLNHFCYGIAHKAGRLYITDWRNSLYIHDIVGTLLQKISTDEYSKSLFSNIRQVVFIDKGNKMLVTDYSEGVTYFDINTKRSYNFLDSELSGAAAICPDGRGNILVGGWNSNNVIQIGRDGSKVGVVVKSSDGLRCPESMCFDRKSSTLIITQNNSNIVKFFDLK